MPPAPAAVPAGAAAEPASRRFFFRTGKSRRLFRQSCGNFPSKLPLILLASPFFAMFLGDHSVFLPDLLAPSFLPLRLFLLLVLGMLFLPGASFPFHLLNRIMPATGFLLRPFP